MRISWWNLKFSVDFPFLSPQIPCLLITMSVSIHGRKKGNGQPVSSALFIRGAKFSSKYPDWTSSYIPLATAGIIQSPLTVKEVRFDLKCARVCVFVCVYYLLNCV